eukprot:5410667-Amphidinium_carterae.1
MYRRPHQDSLCTTGLRLNQQLLDLPPTVAVDITPDQMKCATTCTTRIGPESCTGQIVGDVHGTCTPAREAPHEKHVNSWLSLKYCSSLDLYVAVFSCVDRLASIEAPRGCRLLTRLPGNLAKHFGLDKRQVPVPVVPGLQHQPCSFSQQPLLPHRSPCMWGCHEWHQRTPYLCKATTATTARTFLWHTMLPFTMLQEPIVSAVEPNITFHSYAPQGSLIVSGSHFRCKPCTS